MSFFSFSRIASQVKTVLARYPLEVFAALCGTAIGMVLTRYDISGDTMQYWQRLLMVASLALPSWLAVTLRGRFRGYSTGRKVIEYAIVTGVLVAFYLSLSNQMWGKGITRFLLLNVAAHLLVSCAGFIGRGSTNAFWQFNKQLFLRIISSVIFSGVLLGGLIGALAALSALFNLHVHGEWYGRLFVFIAGVFNTLFFLAGVPDSLAVLEEEDKYPKILKIFSQFVLLPLVVVYLGILLAYEAKITVNWRLPNGWVSNLIIAYGIAGILSILLVHPIRGAEGNRWVKAFARWFYVLLLPLVALMLVAIVTRVSLYGFTEPRVFVLTLAIWLGAMAVYFLVRQNGDIRVIPFSLALLSLLLSAGPFSCFQIAKHSQRSKLEQLFAKNGMLKTNKAVAAPAGKKLSFSDRKQISSSVNYLLEREDTTGLKHFFDIRKLTPRKRWEYGYNAEILLAQVGLKYISDYMSDDNEAVQNVHNSGLLNN